MKKNKKVMIKIFILLVMIMGLVGLMVYGMIKGNFIFSSKTEILYESTFSNIDKIDVTNALNELRENANYSRILGIYN